MVCSKNTFLAFCIVSTLGFLACQLNENTNQEKVRGSIAYTDKIMQVPRLLDRPERVQNGKEWDRVQSDYGKYRSQMVNGEQPDEATVYMAWLFTREARVTGEHGYYYPAALKLLDGLLAKKDLDKNLLFSVLTSKAGILLSQHDFSGALQVGEKAVKLNPYNAHIYGVLTDAYVELGEYEKAIEMADKMVSTRPDLRSYSRVSYLREIHGMIDESIDAMQMAVEAGYPGYEETAWARLMLGGLYENYRTLEDAEKEYLRILQERKDYPFAIAALAEVKSKQGAYEEAISLFKEACDIIPEVGFYIQLASLYKKMNRESDKERLLTQILEMLHDDVVNGHNMNLEYANVYLNLGDNPDKALQFALDEYTKRPKNIDVNLLLAQIYEQKGMFDKAKEHLVKAQGTNAKKPDLIALAEKLNSK